MIEKRKFNGYNVWVDSDKTQHTESGEISLSEIIAADKELQLDGVPTYVEYLAKICGEEIKGRYPKNKLTFYKRIWLYDGSVEGFKKGFETAQKELFTEDDMRWAILKARIRIDKTEPKYTIDEIINQIKQKQ